MKKLILVLNDLEGCGKSATACALSHWMRDREINHALVSSDDKATEDSFYTGYWDMEDLEVTQVISTLDRNDAVIVDVATGSARAWSDFCEAHEIDLLLSELDVDMTLLIPEHPGERCHDEIIDLAELFTDQADYIIAHLPIEPRGCGSAKWKKSQAAKAIDYLGGQEINLPVMTSELETALDSHGITLPEALCDLANLPRFVEITATQWLASAGKAFDKSVAYLVPEEAGLGTF